MHIFRRQSVRPSSKLFLRIDKLDKIHSCYTSGKTNIKRKRTLLPVINLCLPPSKNTQYLLLMLRIQENESKRCPKFPKVNCDV